MTTDMTNPSKTETATALRLVGIYDNLRSAALALESLRQADVPEADISVLFADSPEARDVLQGERSQAGTGAVAGGAVGGVLAAAAASALALPGLGVLAVGPIVAAMGGASLGAASGGILGALVGWGIPKNEAAMRTEEVAKGGVLVGVETDSDRLADTRTLLATTKPAHLIEAKPADA